MKHCQRIDHFWLRMLQLVLTLRAGLLMEIKSTKKVIILVQMMTMRMMIWTLPSRLPNLIKVLIDKLILQINMTTIWKHPQTSKSHHRPVVGPLREGRVGSYLCVGLPMMSSLLTSRSKMTVLPVVLLFARVRLQALLTHSSSRTREVMISRKPIEEKEQLIMSLPRTIEFRIHRHAIMYTQTTFLLVMKSRPKTGEEYG